MAVCWCGREHKPDTAIGAAHAHREHPAMFLAYPFQPRCRCGWHGHVFYKDAYHALGHWLEHAESALTEGEHRSTSRARATDAGPATGTVTTRPAPSVSALDAPAAPKQKRVNTCHPVRTTATDGGQGEPPEKPAAGASSA